MRKTLKKNIILRKTLEEDTASHAVYPAEQGRRMTGSAGTVLDVMVNAIVSYGRRVWGEGGEKSSQIRPRGSSATEGWRNYSECLFFTSLFGPNVSKTLRLPHFSEPPKKPVLAREREAR